MRTQEFLDEFADPLLYLSDEVKVTKPKEFLGVHYQCCNVYARAYVNRDKTAYTGCCPRCGKRVHVAIGPGGTDNRFFKAQ